VLAQSSYSSTKFPPDQIARVSLAQVICGLIPKNGRLCASGLDVARDLLGNTIASECDSHARATASEREGQSGSHSVPFVDVIKICITRKHSNMSAMDVGRPLVGLMRSTSVPGPLLYTSPSAPISSLSTLTAFFLLFIRSRAWSLPHNSQRHRKFRESLMSGPGR
jgi:hypothetical protein